MFIYIQRRTVENVLTGLKQATATRIEASLRQIRNYEKSTGERIGPITRQHFVIRQARQPEEAEFEMPTDNTTRQARFLDAQREEQVRKEEGREGGDNEERNRKKIRIELNGTWVDVRVGVCSLRLTLGLLLHDIFTDGIFHNYEHHETVDADVKDMDHGAVQLASPPPPALPVLQAPASPDSQGLIALRVTNSPSPEEGLGIGPQVEIVQYL